MRMFYFSFDEDVNLNAFNLLFYFDYKMIASNSKHRLK